MLIVITQIAEHITLIAVGPTSITVPQAGKGVGVINNLQILFLDKPKMAIPGPAGLDDGN